MTDLKKFATSVRHNYIVPGLTSMVLARSDAPAGGMVRLFCMERQQEYEVTPHNHRYDFTCLVLAGQVYNRVYESVEGSGSVTHAIFNYDATTKGLAHKPLSEVAMAYDELIYETGEWYSMTHEQFHSIRFSRGAEVLFFEGPQITDISQCLLPISHGRICNTFLSADWMMQP